jgi:phage terminase large subunit-like protein
MRSTDEIEADVHAYIDQVREGSIVTGRYVQLAVRRHVRDLVRGKARKLRFNKKRAMRALWWIEHRGRFTKGEWAGGPFRLSPWQAFIIWCVFGWERKVDGRWLRRFRVAYMSVARKNGKTELAAVIGLIFMVVPGEAEPGGEIYSAATKRDQAAICWRSAAGMVKRNRVLKSEIGIHESRQNLSHYDTDSRFETVSSEADTLDGLGPLMAIIDEYHAHPDSSVFEVLETGMGARREPLMLITTTAGAKRQGACWELETDAVKILEGIGEAEGSGDDLFAFIARLDEGDDWGDERLWPKANPNLNVSCYAEKLRAAHRAARRRTGAVNEFLRKHMNLWTEVSSAWMGMPEWDGCSGPVDLEALKGARARCFVGLDLSAIADYTAAVAVFPREDGVMDVVSAFWIPAETLVERGRTDRVPVMQWVEQGLVTATGGNVVDQDAVKQWLVDLREWADVTEVPTDPHNATKLQTELMKLGFPVVSMRQGWVTMSPAIKQTEILVRKKQLRHGGNPVLRWMFSNVALKRDSHDNLSLHKGRSADRIDGIVALAMAVGRAVAFIEAGGDAPGVYNERAAAGAQAVIRWL